MNYQTPHEAFWAGEFGNEYTERNRGPNWLASNLALFSKIFSRTDEVHSVLECGANIGLNLQCIGDLLPSAELAAIEINSRAVAELRKLPRVQVFQQSILDFAPQRSYDFVFTKGVLIHIDPASLPRVYDLLNQSSSRYICVAEYYSRTPISLSYRGHSDRLYKRDFAGEMLDRFKHIRLVDYRFTYHREKAFPQDDLTWFLLEKVAVGGSAA
jgi:pseudaminic acid biosynthesis-associated methylase